MGQLCDLQAGWELVFEVGDCGRTGAHLVHYTVLFCQYLRNQCRPRVWPRAKGKPWRGREGNRGRRRGCQGLTGCRSIANCQEIAEERVSYTLVVGISHLRYVAFAGDRLRRDLLTGSVRGGIIESPTRVLPGDIVDSAQKATLLRGGAWIQTVGQTRRRATVNT